MSEKQASASAETTHFGFEDVPLSEKAGRVRNVFAKVATRYDVMNDAMSAGLHRLWKKELVAALNPSPRMHLLDLAGGTGDIAFRALARCPEMSVALCDINADMLREGKARAIDKNLIHLDLSWHCGNAESLPFPDRRFDACTIAFGLRNVTTPPLALAEIHRVLKPGGKFMCLEFSPSTQDWLKPFYDWYSFNVIPKMGERITGDGQPYEYLVQSIRRFYKPTQLAAKMEEAGFEQVNWRTMSHGIVTLHSGYRI